MAEQRREMRAVPEEGAVREEGYMGPATRAGYMPAWRSRLSWGSVVAGTFIAIAAMLVIAALVTWIGLAAAAVTDLAALQDVLAAIGIWTAIGALVALFIGAWAASRLAALRFASDGLWHGAVVWSFVLVLGILLSSIGVSGILGFGANIAPLLQGALPTVTVTPEDVGAVTDATASGAGWFLLAALVSLGAALLGGWLGSARESREESAMMEERGRRAA